MLQNVLYNKISMHFTSECMHRKEVMKIGWKKQILKLAEIYKRQFRVLKLKNHHHNF